MAYSNLFQRVVVTGPESSGKTTLAGRLARACQTRWVSEYARVYLDALGRPYEEGDLLEIAKGQWIWERYLGANLSPSQTFLVCDTSLEVIKIWSEYRYGRSHPWIGEQLLLEPRPLYLLCRPDLPWEYDPLRENPHDREVLFSRYEAELERLGASFIVIRGDDWEKRLEQALRAVSG